MTFLSLASCWKADYPYEATPRPEVKEFTAVAGDAEIALEWAPYDEYVPEHYVITYNDVNQDLQTITTTETSYVIENLENDFEYLVGLQVVYAGNQISNRVSATAVPRTTRFPVTTLVVESGNALSLLSGRSRTRLSWVTNSHIGSRGRSLRQFR